ncbi:MAG: hypothetical protein ACXVXN_02075 [Mycobacteriaceae bacterium]
MGQATDGIVFWGVALGDEYEASERVSELVNGDPDDDSSDLYGDGREWLAEHGLTGIEFVHYCSETAPMWGIAAAGTVVTAHRGWVKMLDLPQYPAPDWSINVQRAVEALGLDLGRDKYGWNLVSYWEV